MPKPARKDIPAGRQTFPKRRRNATAVFIGTASPPEIEPKVAEVDGLVERSLGEVSEDGGKKEIGTECICNIQLARPFEQVQRVADNGCWGNVPC